MKIKLTVDDKSIPMNSFTQEVMGKVVLAVAGSLHGVEDDWKRVVVQVEKDETVD